MLRYLLLLTGAIFCSLVLVSCFENNGSTTCDTAACSIAIESRIDAGCPRVATFRQAQFRARNTSAKNIIADFQVFLYHHNQPPLTTNTYDLRRLVLASNVNTSGDDIGLDCQYAAPGDTSDAWDERQFTLTKACFQGYPGCPDSPISGAPTPISAAPKPPSESCATVCNAPDCNTESIPQGAIAVTTHKAILQALSTSQEVDVDLSALLPAMYCKDRDAIKIRGSDFSEGGASCRQYLDLSPPSKDRVAVSVPGRISGRVSRSGTQSQFVFQLH